MSRSLPIVERLASWGGTLDLDEVPAEARDVAKRCIVDLVGVAIAGAALPQSRRLAGYARQFSAPGPATLFDFSDRLSAVGAALVNANAGHILDFDDTSYSGIMHGSVVVLPAALAAAETAGASGRRFLEAFIVGSETAYSIGKLCTDSHYNKGWWSTSTLGVFGAAAAAAKAMHLSTPQTANAIALAGVQAGALKAAFGTDAKPYLAGKASAIGVEAALLAGNGFSAPVNVMEDSRGFLKVLNDGIVNDAGIERLGTEWRLVDPGILFKQYPVCSAAHASVELTKQLIEENGLMSQEIQRVVCEVPPLVAASLVYEAPQSAQQAQFSMQFAVGTMLAYGRLGIEHISSESLSDPQIRSQMSKIEMRRVDSLQHAETPECSRTTITASDGSEFTGFLGEPRGMPGNPMTDEELRQKFMDCAAAGGVPRGRSAALLDHLTEIESKTSPLLNIRCRRQ